MQKEVLVIGATGLVGSALMRRFGDRAAGTCTSRKQTSLLTLDVTDPSKVRAVMEQVEPSIVVLAAALTAVDGCERDSKRSWTVNVGGARNVAAACAFVGARLVFFSSDYVFGEGGPHALDALPRPLNVYGNHKLEAERLILAGLDDCLIIRTCNVYGYQPGGKNFAMAVLDLNRAGRTMRVPADQWGNPTPAGDLADAVVAAAESDVRGIVHLAGPDYVDRLTWARRVAEVFELDPRFIEATETVELGQTATRPLRAGLDARESCSRLGVRIGGLDDGLARLREQWQQSISVRS